MGASRQPQLLWNFIVAYKQATGRQLSYVNLSRDRIALQQALNHASQIRDQALQRVVEELEADLLEAAPAPAPDITVVSTVEDLPTAANDSTTESDLAKQQGYVDMVASFLEAGVITLEYRQQLDEYCLAHDLSWSKAEVLERLWRASHSKNALSWREEFKRGVTTLQKNRSLTEADRLRLYHTYIKRGRLTIAEAESAAMIATAGKVQQQSAWLAFLPSQFSNSFTIVAGVGFALMLAVIWLAAMNGEVFSFATAQRSSADNAAPPPVPIDLKPMLRIHGSNTLGSHLIPALAEAYLKQLGSASIQRIAGTKDNETNVYGLAASVSHLIEIRAHGSATAFTSLKTNAADLGAASRPIKVEESADLDVLGDMTGPACEHVIGLDGVAVIVHPSNTITALSKMQVAAIFSGGVKDWQAVGGVPGPIHIHARDDKSGTYETFSHLVMGKLKIDLTAKRYESNDVLSDRVASDPAAIGFVALPAVRSSKTLAVSGGGTAILPTHFTIATEDYPLSRRLYLYSLSKPTIAAQEFLNLTLSDTGQAIVAKEGFVDLRPESQGSARDPSSPHRYLILTENAERLSLNFRFRSGAKALDNKAQRDLDRLVGYFSQANNVNKRIMLLGFSYDSGAKAHDQELSENDAKTVADAMQMRGLYPSAVEGFGSAMPIASNIDADGKMKNRRVEIWVR